MTELAEGQSIPLLYTAKSRERVVAGLSWDPRGKTSMMDRLKGDNQQYDLDITCFVFDEYKEYIDFVGAEAQANLRVHGRTGTQAKVHVPGLPRGQRAGEGGSRGDDHIPIALLPAAA